MTDEEIKKELDACYAAEKQIKEDFFKAKQVFKEKGKYKGDFTELQEELFDGLLYAQHIGYVNVELLSGTKNTVGRYSTTERFFKVVDDGTKEAKEIQKLTFSEEVIDVIVGDDDEQCFYLVCQWCNYEDDYKGYILLPMKDGRYWCFYYQM